MDPKAVKVEVFVIMQGIPNALCRQPVETVCQTENAVQAAAFLGGLPAVTDDFTRYSSQMLARLPDFRQEAAQS